MEIKKGGFEGPEGWVFELTGGALCLDFVNTLDNRPTDHARELLGTYADLIGWSRQAGIIGKEEAETLYTRARGEPEAAEETIVRARRLRESLYAIFSSAVEGNAPPPMALKILNAEIPLALSRQTITRTKDGYQLKGAEHDALDLLLLPVVRSAVDLLTSPDLSRVRVCAADSCRWLFVDRSRNRTRQWCDMSVCGNRAKARRHYRRTRRRTLES